MHVPTEAGPSDDQAEGLRHTTLTATAQEGAPSDAQQGHPSASGSEKVVKMFAIGAGSGFLAGVFGVGGGILTVPSISLATDLNHKEVCIWEVGRQFDGGGSGGICAAVFWQACPALGSLRIPASRMRVTGALGHTSFVAVVVMGVVVERFSGRRLRHRERHVHDPFHPPGYGVWPQRGALQVIGDVRSRLWRWQW